ncbi:SAM-dependent methyltransferase [Leuconostoc lactis]|uniref:SAM-dependent methyltransferase n=1 Tax=Leuconostoc lactis TaxID=1246 RepID=UPI0021A75846|nr:SAM-dependent methyltransferase [Leuconostoc lactis]MCT3114633.1 DNA methyltransferase [Leuconostoc lactis]
MTEQLIKSKKRVQQHGEVFTPKKIVNLMLNQAELQENLRDLSSTFLEPSAGEGAFLTEILRRKLKIARQISASRDEYDENALIALSSLYGIELLEDNIELLVMNMIITFSNEYTQTVMADFTAKADDGITRHVIDSAKTIIRANMVHGNALTHLDDRGESLLFSEWQLLPIKRGVRKVQRILYTFDAVLHQGNAEATVQIEHPAYEAIDLFADLFEDDEPKQPKSEKPLVQYVPVKLTEVYKELVETIGE